MAKQKQPPKQPTLKEMAQHYQVAYRTFMLELYRRALIEMQRHEP